MDTRLQNNTGSAEQLQLIVKPSFWMQYQNVTAPKPTRNYHYHDCYELYYLYSGERYYFIKDKTYHVKSGSLVLVNAYDIHATTNSAAYGYSRMLINFKKEYLACFREALGDIDPLFCFKKDIHIISLPAAGKQHVESVLQLMMEQYSSRSDEQDLILKTSLLQLLLLANRYKVQQEQTTTQYLNSTHKTISQITGYINNNYFEDITLESISNRFYISPYYFSRVFKQVTGFTFIEYLNGVRIKESQKLLCNTDMHISDIAEAVGYKSTTHFGRLFRKANGISPSGYRKYHQEQAARTNSAR